MTTDLLGQILTFLGGGFFVTIVGLAWRLATGETRADINGKNAANEKTYQELYHNSVADLDDKTKRVEDLEDYNRQLMQIIRNQGGFPPPFKRQK
jgi:hypothetical protein